eukprot:g9035.t1
MPRRIGDYPDAYAAWNSLASYGSYVSIISTILFFIVVYDTLTSDTPINTAGAPGINGAMGDVSPTLEWLLSSPPTFHTFTQLPAIKG